MPVLTNTRRERFAQLVASGKTYTDAYEGAGYARNDSNAAQMVQNPGVTARITELNAQAAELTVEHVKVTAIELMGHAKRIMKSAEMAGNHAAAVSALKEYGVLSGERIERSERGEAGEFAALADTEVEAALAARLNELGIEFIPDTQH